MWIPIFATLKSALLCCLLLRCRREEEVMFSPRRTVSSARVWVCQDASHPIHPPALEPKKTPAAKLSQRDSSLCCTTSRPQCHGLHSVRDHGGEAATVAGTVACPAREQDCGGGGRVQHQPHTGLHLLQHQPGTLPATTCPHVSRQNQRCWKS